jgi:sec-independent protein translocase protein TatA
MVFSLAGLPGGYEVWIILVIILLLFGRRIPQVARSLGQGISQFKKGLSDPEAEVEAAVKAEEAKAAKAAKSEKNEESAKGDAAESV